MIKAAHSGQLLLSQFVYLFPNERETMLRLIKHSFAARLNFYILLFLFLAGGTGFIIFHHYAIRYIEQQTYTRLNAAAEQLNQQVSGLLRTIEKIPENLSWIIPSYVTHADSIFNITRQVVQNNLEIFGCAIAFEPNHFPAKGCFFAPYSYMQGDSVITTEIDTRYDYYHKNWYKIAKDLNTSRWSHPYHELSTEDIITTTYSVPLHDAQKNVIGIFSVDLSLNWLNNLLDSLRLYEDCYNIIIDQKGRYILRSAYPKFPLNTKDEEVLNFVTQMEDSAAIQIAQRMLHREKGWGIFKNQDIPYYVYYTPINGTQWSLGTILPYSHIFSGLHNFNRLLILCFSFLVILMVIIITFIIRKITQPLNNFAASTHEIANGNFSTQLPVIHSQDEMGDLYKAFKEMQEKLAVYIDNLTKTTADKEKIESELRIAHDIQMDMLPKTFPPFPERNELDLYAVLHPARQVGGDLYDFFIKDNCLYFTIGDVSGKGIPASLLMASTISLLRSLANNYNSPAQIANLLNKSIAERNEADMFITIFIGILNLENGTMKYCNAGHTPPILTHPDQKVTFFNIQADIPLGIIQDYTYQDYLYQFDNGSGILLYTDGVTDAENINHEFYSKERLLHTTQNKYHLHPREFIGAILEDIRRHVQSHPNSDDLSMLTFIYGTKWNIQNK